MVLFFAGTSDNPGQVGHYWCNQSKAERETELSSSQQFAFASIHGILFLPELCEEIPNGITIKSECRSWAIELKRMRSCRFGHSI